MTMIRPTHLILGGRHMGKRAWAETLYGSLSPLCDLERDAPEGIEKADFVVNLHFGVKGLLLLGCDALDFFAARRDDLRGKVLIGDEVGAGVVPLDAFERRWRDETGELYQMLTQEADVVDRVWAGLAERLKG